MQSIRVNSRGFLGFPLEISDTNYHIVARIKTSQQGGRKESVRFLCILNESAFKSFGSDYYFINEHAFTEEISNYKRLESGKLAGLQKEKVRLALKKRKKEFEASQLTEGNDQSHHEEVLITTPIPVKANSFSVDSVEKTSW